MSAIILYHSSCSTTSEEICILQAINTKDRGHMYTPHSHFVPFFHDVDKCVKKIINPTGFQEHGSESELDSRGVSDRKVEIN